MEVPKFALTWGVLQVVLILVSTADSAKISLFKKKDHTDLRIEITPTKDCFNIPKKDAGEVNSITTDVCFIAYSDADCKSPWTSKFDPGQHVATKTSLGFEWPIDSIQRCNEHEGGPELNVDITTHFENKYPPVVPEVLEKFTDVCGCKNIPAAIQEKSKWSIDNHANDVLVYFEPNCEETKSSAFQINAGHWVNSRDMHTHVKYTRGATLQIQSFGPVENSTYFKHSCKPAGAPKATQGAGAKDKPKSKELDAELLEENFKTLGNKIEELDSQIEHKKRDLDFCQENIDNLQGNYSTGMKNVTEDFKKLEKDNEDLNNNNLELGNVMLNVTKVVEGLQLVNQNLKSKVRSLEEKSKRAKLEQDLSMEDKFKIQMEQFQQLLQELNKS